jgi:hypothetical protein
MRRGGKPLAVYLYHNSKALQLSLSTWLVTVDCYDPVIANREKVLWKEIVIESFVLLL